MPLRVMLLITVHVVSTVVMVVSTLTFEPPVQGPIFSTYIFWPKIRLLGLLIPQIYLVVFWVCLGNSAPVRRPLVGSLILVGMGTTYLGVKSESANWTSELVMLLVQLLVIALPLLALRLTGRHLVADLPDRKVGGSSVRLSLKDLLVGITVGTVYLALVRFLILNREQLSLTSAVFPLVGLACVVPIFFAARCWKLLLVVVAMQVILTAIIGWIDAQQVVESLGRMDYFHARIGPPEPIPVQDIFLQELPRIASDVLFITVILLGSLLVIRSCGYRWARCDDELIR